MTVLCCTAVCCSGMYLTWGVRSVPSQFNESVYIGICIYNVAIVSAFVLPLVSARMGGRSVTYQIRAYAIMFLSLSTVAVLFVPKFFTILTAHGLRGGGDISKVLSADDGTSISPKASTAGTVKGQPTPTSLKRTLPHATTASSYNKQTASTAAPTSPTASNTANALTRNLQMQVKSLSSDNEQLRKELATLRQRLGAGDSIQRTEAAALLNDATAADGAAELTDAAAMPGIVNMHSDGNDVDAGVSSPTAVTSPSSPTAATASAAASPFTNLAALNSAVDAAPFAVSSSPSPNAIRVRYTKSLQAAQ